jgi:hypothetical protein
VLVTLALLELGAAMLLRHSPDFASREEIQAGLSRSSQPPSAGSTDSSGTRSERRAGHNVLHPYLGFVPSWNPALHNEVNRRVVDLPVNELGFFGPAPPRAADSHVLTGVFRDQTRNIYRDDCCHLTEPGYALLAERIGRQVASVPDRAW